MYVNKHNTGHGLNDKFKLYCYYIAIASFAIRAV